MLSGRCACGVVAYRLTSQPYDSGWCHCRICQHVSGSIGMVFTTVALKDFHLTQGADQVGVFASTSFGERSFAAPAARQ